ncbi:MAG: hypothetical protein ND895_18535 [Pyrinomonadaceae bacterium]|nr:hypothetical protein [Pyrinomonadaceae bacterium]
MRRVILIILFFISSCFGVGDTFAQCSCLPSRAQITPHNEFKLADAVFVGRIIAIAKTAPDKKTDSYVETVKFEVRQAWKQDLETVVTITNKVQGCVNGFKEQEEWLVYAYKKRDGTLGAYCCCTRTRRLSEAAEDLKEFGEKGEEPTTVSKPRAGG